MLKSLYDIQIDHAAIIEELFACEGELSPELEFALAINKEELEAKAEGYALRIIEFNGQAEFLANEIKRLQARKKQFENTATRLEDTISAAMIQFKVEKIKTPKVTLSFRKSESVEVPENFTDDILRFVTIKAEIDPEKVKLLTESATENNAPAPKIPAAELLSYFKLSASLNVAQIKAELKSGITVADITLITNKNLQIK